MVSGYETHQKLIVLTIKYHRTNKVRRVGIGIEFISRRVHSQILTKKVLYIPTCLELRLVVYNYNINYIKR